MHKPDPDEFLLGKKHEDQESGTGDVKKLLDGDVPGSTWLARPKPTEEFNRMHADPLTRMYVVQITCAHTRCVRACVRPAHPPDNCDVSLALARAASVVQTTCVRRVCMSACVCMNAWVLCVCARCRLYTNVHNVGNAPKSRRCRRCWPTQ